MRPISRLGLGAVFLLLIVLAALLSLVWTPYDPLAVSIGERLRPPSGPHPFGTDAFGRDVLSEILTGARYALLVAVSATVIGVGLGVPLGLSAAAQPGPVDGTVMRASDLMFAFPAVLVAVLLAAGFGPGLRNGVLAVGLYGIPVFARLVRNAARGQWNRAYVRAARVAGRGRLDISLRHILPNILGIIANQATIQLSIAILADAGLSYVGLGTQPPAPSWGRMLKEAQTLIDVAPWLSIFPGLAVMLTVSGFLLLGDGLGALHRRVRFGEEN